MNRLSIFPLSVACLALLLLIPLPEASARNPVVTKLHPRPGDVDREGFLFGTEVAVNENWIVVGATDFGPANPLSPGDGSVYVFSARTGRFVRRIQPSRDLFGGQNGNAFGSSMALCGNRLLVGAPFFVTDSSNSAALLYDLPSGRLEKLVRLENPSQQSNFGRSVALSERWIVIGEEHADDFGRVHVFDASTGDLAFTLQASDGFINSGFGGSLALCGDILAVGAQDVIGFTTGAVYLYDLDEGGTELRKLTPSDGAASDWFGRRLAMEGGRLLVGAEFHQFADGAAYLYDVGTGNLIRKLTAPDPGGAGRFGHALALSGNLALIVGSKPYLMDVLTGDVIRELSVADNATSFSPGSVSLCGNLAVLGNSQDDDLNTNSGAAYFFRPLAGPLPLTTLTQRGNSVGTQYPEAEYRAFQAPAIDPVGGVAFTASLSGPGSGGGRDKLITTSVSQLVIPRHKTRDPIPFYGPGLVIQGLRPPIYNRAGRYINHQFLRGPGVNAFNRQVIRGTFGSLILRTGDPIPALTDGLGTPEALAFTEIVQKPGNTGDSLVAAAYRLRRGVGGVNPTNDSGILVLRDDGTVVGSAVRENTDASNGDTFAQFFGRVAQNNSSFFAHSAWVIAVEGGPARQQSFSNGDTTGSHFNVARQGANAPLRSGDPADSAKFRSMLGEGMQGNFGLVRASVVPDANHRGITEGIWREGGGIARVLKGEEFDRPGTFLQRILRFWPVGNGNLVLLIKLTGPAVNPGNDCALVTTEYLSDFDEWELTKLVREGDEISDWDCPRVRTIQRVDVDPISGHYAVVVALTGSPARNQAVLTGNANLAHPNFFPGGSGDFTALRRPHLVLRKGTLYNTRYAESTRLRSIVMEPRIDRTGSGGKGLGQVINETGEVALCLQFDNGAKELVVGKP